MTSLNIIFTFLFFIFIQITHAKSTRSGFFVFDGEKKYLKTILQHKDLTVDHLNSIGYEVYGPLGLKDYLVALEVDFSELLDEKQEDAFKSYPTPEEIAEDLKKLARDNRDIVKLLSIGKSHQGREVLAIKISDRVEFDEVDENK